jgi:hypothetical protein
VVNVSRGFEAALSLILVVHNFDYGDEFEVALCQILRSILPMKYGICRGHVVAINGEKAGDDIIIFDRMKFPTVRSLAGEDYSRKEQVPIEAVYAYVEAKHTLQVLGNRESSLQHAMDQVCRVKALCHQRASVSVATSEWQGSPNYWPPIRNPPYGVIVSRHVRQSESSPALQDPAAIRDALVGAPATNDHPPDLVIAGRSNLLLPVLRSGNGQFSMPSPFHLPRQSEFIPQVVPEVGFGAGVFVLLWALDWICLGEMPWQAILNDCLTRYLGTAS